jgi:hypothetical protein
MKVVTCITNTENPGYKYALKASCKYYGLELITIVAEDTEWSSHRNKDIELSKVLLTLNPDELVLFTDGYDTFFIGNEEKIVSRYHYSRNNKDILIAAEQVCFPDASLASRFDDTKSTYNYLNSGGIMAPAGVLLEAIKNLKNIREGLKEDPFPFSNQYLWSLYFLDNKNNIKLDSNCCLFQTFTPKVSTDRELRGMPENSQERQQFAKGIFKDINDNFEINGIIGLTNKKTGQSPLHLHFNSPISRYNMFQEPYLSWIEHLNT